MFTLDGRYIDDEMMVLVNPGTVDETRCNCVIPPRAIGMHLGYYPLRNDTKIRFYTRRANYEGRFREVANIASRVETMSGSVRMRIPQ